jgi:putative tryptophan/tyrosine transport system substrate-binding protein
MSLCLLSQNSNSRANVRADRTFQTCQVNPTTAPFAEYWLNPFKTAAATFAVEAIVAPVRDASERESVLAAQPRKPNGGLIAMPDTFLAAHRAEVTSLAARYRLPAVYGFRYFADVGGLIPT